MTDSKDHVMTTPEHSTSISVELMMLRGDMREGFARVEGRLELIAQAQSATAADVADLDRRVDALEARRIPVALLAGTSGVVSAVVAAAALFVR